MISLYHVSQERWTRSAKCWRAAGLHAYTLVPGMKFWGNFWKLKSGRSRYERKHGLNIWPKILHVIHDDPGTKEKTDWTFFHIIHLKGTVLHWVEKLQIFLGHDIIVGFVGFAFADYSRLKETFHPSRVLEAMRRRLDIRWKKVPICFCRFRLVCRNDGNPVSLSQMLNSSCLDFEVGEHTYSETKHVTRLTPLPHQLHIWISGILDPPQERWQTWAAHGWYFSYLSREQQQMAANDPIAIQRHI